MIFVPLMWYMFSFATDLNNTVAVLSTFNCFNLFQRENRLRDAHLITSSCSEELTKAWKTNFSRHFSSDAAVQNYFNTNKQVLYLDDVVIGYALKLVQDSYQGLTEPLYWL